MWKKTEINVLWLMAIGLFISTNALPSVTVNKLNQFQTSDGKVLILHGTSLVRKEVDMVEVSDEVMAFISTKLGFNTVRLGFLWNLLETSPGVYNMTYLNLMEDLVNRFAKHGIYTFLDMHQDTWSNFFCGQGIPDFYSHPYDEEGFYPNGEFAFPAPLPVKPKYGPNATGHFPQITNCGDASSTILGWGGKYATFALGAAAQRLYDNDGGILDRFGDMWELVAKRFVNHTSVLGYELINEPWVGDGFRNPTIFFPENAEKQNLQRMNSYLHKRIRKVDDHHIIFFEPATGGNMALGLGYTEGPGGPEYNDRQVLSYHIYCPKLVIDVKPDNKILQWIIKYLGPWAQDQRCEAVFEKQGGAVLDAAKKLGVAGLLTEFGSVTNEDVIPESQIGAWIAMNKIQDMLDHNLAGWIYWELDNKAQSYQQVNPIVLGHLTRTYAKSIAGIPTDMRFNNDTGEFRLSYKPDTTNNAATITDIYYNPQFHYPNGAQCQITPVDSSVSCHMDPDNNRILVEQKNDHMQSDTTITVTVTAVV